MIPKKIKKCLPTFCLWWGGESGPSAKWENSPTYTFVLANVSLLIWLLLTGRNCPPSFILRIIFIFPEIPFHMKINLYEKILILPVELNISSWAIRVWVIKGWMIEATQIWRSIFPIPIRSTTARSRIPTPVKSNPRVCFTCRQVGGEAD